MEHLGIKQQGRRYPEGHQVTQGIKFLANIRYYSQAPGDTAIQTIHHHRRQYINGRYSIVFVQGADQGQTAKYQVYQGNRIGCAFTYIIAQFEIPPL